MTKTEERSAKPKEKISEKAMKDLLSDRLDHVGASGIYVCTLFFLCVTPNILNGFHVSSYKILGHVPDVEWCTVTDFRPKNWTLEQQISISQRGLETKGCTVWDWDYRQLSNMSYNAASNYTSKVLAVEPPAEVSCNARGRHEMENPRSTFVADWGLVCDNALQRTNAQVTVSLGKLIGSFSFGIFADKFGRKTAFSLGSAFFIVASLLCTFSPWYLLFLVGRFGLGAASSGLFYPAFTMVVENIGLKHRSWIAIAFSASYPVGMIVLAVAGYYVQPWRHLQFALTVPAFFLILNCYLMKESPRWLLTKKRYDRAYKILFKEESHYEIDMEKEKAELVADKTMTEIPQTSLWTQIKNGPFKQFIALFANWHIRKLIFTSYFMFCVTSLCYYVTALNAENLSVSRYFYLAATGIVDLPSYLVPVIMLRFTGRRTTTMSLFFFTGISLLLVLAVPSSNTIGIVSFAMLGRFGISATYAVVTLYAAELFPTEIRNSALGTCSTWAHVGSILAPYIVDVFGLLGWYIPTTICGCSVLMAGILTLVLPETGVSKLADSLHEVKKPEKQEKQEKPDKSDVEKNTT